MVPAQILSLLERRRIPFTTLHHVSANTAQHEAASAHIQGRHWAKTVVCFADGEPIQAVLPAPCAVDFERLRALAKANSIRLAAHDELPPMYPGCEPGTAPPLKPLFGQRVFLDQSLVGDPAMVVNAGTHTDGICLHSADFSELSQPVVGTFADWPGRRT
jgi:Ala-tRNA(Pro) deacylase